MLAEGGDSANEQDQSRGDQGVADISGGVSDRACADGARRLGDREDNSELADGEPPAF